MYGNLKATIKGKEVKSLVYNKSEIARKTGLSRVAVTNILNGKQKNPKLDTLERLAETMDCSIDELKTKIKTDAVS